MTAKVEIIGIGTSTGGPNALAEVMRAFPADFSAPVVIVQHMPAFFTAQLAARLDQISGLTVREGSRGEVLQPGCAYLAPAEHHMTLERSPDGVRIKIDQGPKVHSCRPAVDPLFRTLADVYGNSALVAILTGMGYDGSAGCEAVRDAGGRVIAQDEPTSVVWGMPGAVVTAGLADSILPLPDIGPTLVRLVNTSRGRPATEPGITERTS